MIEYAIQAPPLVRRFQWVSLVIGVVALALCVAYGIFGDPAQFFRSYLIGYLYWVMTSLGCLGVLMLQHISGGIWGAVLRRFLEAGAMSVVLMLVLSVPVVLGFSSLYIWAGARGTEHFKWLLKVSPYLNLNFVLIRLGGYFLVWIVLAVLLSWWSRKLDFTGDARFTARMSALSGPGAVLSVASVLFFSTDLIMSLEPEWYSTIFSFLIVASALLQGMVLCVAMLALLSGSDPLSRIISPLYFGDYGKIILAIVVFWTYLGFSQLLIIWSGNLPREVTWYVHRSAGGWTWVGMFLLIFEFFLPLLLLLSRAFKRSAMALSVLCILILFAQLVNVFWDVEPSFHARGFFLSWTDVIAPIGIGGLWLAVFCWWLRRRPLLPLHLVPERHPRSVEEVEARMEAENA